MSPLEQAAAILRKAKNILVFTGAGISRESGIPTYREPQTGIWANYDPKMFATSFGYLLQSELAWQWHEHSLALMQQAQPNAAHHALAAWQQRQTNVQIVTQNIDDLHERAGSTDVVHLHGSILRHRCFNNCQGTPTLLDLATLQDERKPPRCPHCGTLIRPDIVWFGEMLDPAHVRQMKERVAAADVLLCIGLSGAITYNVPQTIQAQGGYLLEMNPHTTEITPLMDVVLNGAAGEMLPKLLSLL